MTTVIETKNKDSVDANIIYPKEETIQQSRAENVFGMFRTTDVIPTKVPIKMVDQIVIYSSGATFKLYVFDTTAKAWKSVVIA